MLIEVTELFSINIHPLGWGKVLFTASIKVNTNLRKSLALSLLVQLNMKLRSVMLHKKV